MMSTRPRLRWLLLAALILATGLGVRHCRSQGDTLRYEQVALDRGAVAQSVAANGQLSPVKLVSVGTQVSGIVRSYTADFNDRVTAGQVLMKLDDSLLSAQIAQSRANLAAAEAQLALARAAWSRIQPIARDGYASAQELDQARQALRDAEARVAQAAGVVKRDTVNLGYTEIRSPVSGVVVSRAVDVGQTVTASFQTPELYKIAQDLREMLIDAYFTESDIGSIRVGQEASFRVDAFPDRRFKGVVRQVRLNPKTEQNVVTYDVVIGVDNPDGALLPGMTAYVRIDTERKADVLRVPTAALRFRPPEEAVIVEAPEASKPASKREDGERKPRGRRETGTLWVDTGKGLRAVSVKLGINDRKYTEITGGPVKAGDRVVVEQILAEGEAAKKGMKFRMSE